MDAKQTAAGQVTPHSEEHQAIIPSWQTGTKMPTRRLACILRTSSSAVTSKRIGSVASVLWVSCICTKLCQVVALTDAQAAPTVMPKKCANATLCEHTFLNWSQSGTMTKTKTPQGTILLGQTRLYGGRLWSAAAGSRGSVVAQTDA